MSETLTISEAVNIASIVNAVESGARVARLTENGDVVYGTARSIGTDGGAFIHDGDVRDAFLRVTLTTGFEAFWPMRELMSALREGSFVIDPTMPDS